MSRMLGGRFRAPRGVFFGRGGIRRRIEDDEDEENVNFSPSFDEYGYARRQPEDPDDQDGDKEEDEELDETEEMEEEDYEEGEEEDEIEEEEEEVRIPDFNLP